MSRVAGLWPAFVCSVCAGFNVPGMEEGSQFSAVVFGFCVALMLTLVVDWLRER